MAFMIVRGLSSWLGEATLGLRPLCTPPTKGLKEWARGLELWTRKRPSQTCSAQFTGCVQVAKV